MRRGEVQQQKFRDVVRAARAALEADARPPQAPGVQQPRTSPGFGHVFGFGSSPPTSAGEDLLVSSAAVPRAAKLLPANDTPNAVPVPFPVPTRRASRAGQEAILLRRVSAITRRSSVGHRSDDGGAGIDYAKLCAHPDVKELAFRALVAAIEERSHMPRWRRLALSIVTENKVFDRVVLMLIFLNCVFLAFEDPTDSDNDSAGNKVVKYSEFIFTGCFTVEMLLRVAGQGLILSSFAYLRDPYNVIDFIIVLAGLASIALTIAYDGTQAGGVSGLRAFRVLRPLRAVTKVKEVQTIVNSLIQSIPKMVDVMLLYLFFILMMGIVAVQLWKGKLQYHCVRCTTGVCGPGNWSSVRAEQPTRVCSPSFSPTHAYNCPWGYECLATGNPNHGKTSFDNIGVAMLTLFTAVTMEGWSNFMYDVSDATTRWAVLYFVVLMLFGAFYIINLTLVIINDAFHKNLQLQREKEREVEEERERARERRAKSIGLIGSAARLKNTKKTGTSFAFITSRLLGTTSGSQKCLNADRTSVRRRIAAVIRGRNFTWGIMLCIFLNTVFLAIEHHGQPDELSDVLWWTYVIFTGLFAVESVLKVTCFSSHEFFMDRFNVFDLCVVLVSFVDIIFLADQSTGVSVLRTFRLMRIFKLAKQFPTIWRFFQAVMRSVEGVAVLTVLLCLVIFVYALLGMQFFGGNFCNAESSGYPDANTSTCPNLPRSNFDHLGWSLLTVFQVITGEDWNFVMYNAMLKTTDAAFLYFVTLFVVGNYVVLNLFVAVLLSGLETTEDDDDDDDDDDENGDDEVLGPGSPHYIKTDLDIPLHSATTPMGSPLSILTEPQKQPSTRIAADASLCAALFSCLRDTQTSPVSSPRVRASVYAEHQESSPAAAVEGTVTRTGDDASEEGTRPQPGTMLHPGANESRGMSDGDGELWAKPVERQWKGRADHFRDALQQLCREADPPEPIQNPSFGLILRERNHALLLLPHHLALRRYLVKLVEHPWFEGVVIALIVLSTVALALEDPLSAPDRPLPRALALIDLLLLVAFGAEALMKIVAYGFICHRDSYLRRDSWNRLDFGIVVIGVISEVSARMSSGSTASEDIEALRIMRTLRPLRFVNKFAGLKLVVDVLVGSIKQLTNVVVFTGMIMMIFGIMGVQFFAGKFYSCSNKQWGDVSREQGVSSKGECAFRWETYPSNFDNLLEAVQSLFEMATLEGWVAVMHLGMDAVNKDRAPVKNNQPWMSLYFIVFMVVGSFFLVNLFVGVLIGFYEKSREASEPRRAFDGTAEQNEWRDTLEVMVDNTRPMKMQVDMGKLRLTAHSVVTHWGFDSFITFCIVLNVLTMSMEHADQTDAFSRLLLYSNLTFISIFVMEVVMKMLAFGIRGYLDDRWNDFDLAVVVMSTAGVVIDFLLTSGPVFSVFRALRLARLLRVVRMAKGVRTLLRTLFLALPSLVNVASLLALLFFLYAVMGVKLYGRAARGEFLTEHANFDNFLLAVLTLFRMCTGEGWQGIMHDCEKQEPYCDEQLDGCATGYRRWFARFFFISFMILAMFVLLNLIIAVILSQYEAATEEAQQVVTSDYVQYFELLWEKLDPTQSGVFPTTKLVGFLQELGDEWRRLDGLDDFEEITRSERRAWVKRVVSTDMYDHATGDHIPLREFDGEVHYRDLLTACCAVRLEDDQAGRCDLARVRSASKLTQELPPSLLVRLERRWAELFPDFRKRRGDPLSGVTVAVADGSTARPFGVVWVSGSDPPLVYSVEDGSPAAACGLRPMSKIISINCKSVHSPTEAQEAIAEAPTKFAVERMVRRALAQEVLAAIQIQTLWRGVAGRRRAQSFRRPSPILTSVGSPARLRTPVHRRITSPRTHSNLTVTPSSRHTSTPRGPLRHLSLPEGCDAPQPPAQPRSTRLEARVSAQGISPSTTMELPEAAPLPRSSPPPPPTQFLPQRTTPSGLPDLSQIPLPPLPQPHQADLSGQDADGRTGDVPHIPDSCASSRIVTQSGPNITVYNISVQNINMLPGVTDRPSAAESAAAAAAAEAAQRARSTHDTEAQCPVAPGIHTAADASSRKISPLAA